MPAGSHQAPILSCDPEEQLRQLRRALAPERWPLDASLLPADALLVGGAVRDALLGRLADQPDLDLVVEGDAVALARGLARSCGGSCVVLDAERSIARLVVRGWSFDLARRMGADRQQDLDRRDYSINAIALPLAWLLETATDPDAAAGPRARGPIAPGGGLEDLRARRIRALGEANLLEDPLRLLRGLRLACELTFAIEPQTFAWIRLHHGRLAGVAGERVLAELERLAAAPAGADWLAQAWELGLLDLPTGTQDKAAWQQRALRRLQPSRAADCGLLAEEAAWALPLARLAAVLSPATLQHLRASRRLQQRIRRLRRWLKQLESGAGGEVLPQEPPGLTLSGLPEAERLALQQELEEDLPALALHLEGNEARNALERWRNGADPLFHPRSPLDGQALQAQLGIAPGRSLGELLAHLSRERAFGRLGTASEPEQVLTAARQWLAARGRSAPAGASDGRAP